MNWLLYPNFTEDEFRCKGQNCCGNVALMNEAFMERLQNLRNLYARPIVISSGYRCPEHNSRVSNTGFTGPHTTGKAADIRVSGTHADDLLRLAYMLHFWGKGISQKGDFEKRFIHLDMLEPRLWSY